MAQIATYDYQFHGGPTGYRDERAIVRLYGSDHQTVAYIHFVLTGNPIPPNKAADPWIRMYMPETLISEVMEMLRRSHQSASTTTRARCSSTLATSRSGKRSDRQPCSRR